MSDDRVMGVSSAADAGFQIWVQLTVSKARPLEGGRGGGTGARRGCP